MRYTGAMQIDIISDVVCPWCYIGKRRLERALAEFAVRAPHVVPERRWHPFELNPDLPAEGVDRAQYLASKFGGAERAAAVYARVRAAGESVGLALDFDGIARQPNTRDAHRLLAWASEQSLAVADHLAEVLFRAYFTERRFVGDPEVLVALASDVGLDGGEARAMLASDAHRGAIEALEQRAHGLGVTGVPFFIFADRLAVSGAQTPEVMLEALTEAVGLLTTPMPASR